MLQATIGQKWIFSNVRLYLKHKVTVHALPRRGDELIVDGHWPHNSLYGNIIKVEHRITMDKTVQINIELEQREEVRKIDSQNIHDFLIFDHVEASEPKGLRFGQIIYSRDSVKFDPKNFDKEFS